RRTIYIGEGLWQEIKWSPRTLGAALAHELFHMANHDRLTTGHPMALHDPIAEETAAEVRESEIDADRTLRRKIHEIARQLTSRVTGRPGRQVRRRSNWVTQYLAGKFNLGRQAASRVIEGTEVNVVRSGTQPHAGGAGIEITIPENVNTPARAKELIQAL